MKNPKYKVFKYSLAPGENQTINRPANTLICLDATAPFEIGFDDQPLTSFEKGLRYEAAADFKKVRIKNPTGSTISVELGFASGGVGDSRLTLAGSLTVDQQGGNTLVNMSVSALATAETVVSVANLSRHEILVSNLGTDTVFLGGAGVLNNTGLPLAAGATATLQTKAAVSVYNPAAAAVALAILELSK